MSATFSNELQLYQYLDEDRVTTSDENDAHEVQPTITTNISTTNGRARPPVMLSKTGSTTFRGSFSEIMAAKEEKLQIEQERIMYDSLFPSKTLVDSKEKKTFFANPLCADNQDEPYVIEDPDEEELDRKPSPRPFSVRVSSLLGIFKQPQNGDEGDEEESTPRRSFSMRLTTPSSSRASSFNAGNPRDKSSSSLKKHSSSEEPNKNKSNNNKSMRMSRRLIKRLTGQSTEAEEEDQNLRYSSAETTTLARTTSSVRMSMKIKKLLFSQQ